MNPLNKIVYDLAKQNGACRSALMHIPTATTQKLIDLLACNTEYLVEDGRQWLTPDFLKEHATLDQLNKGGVYIDQKVIIKNPTINLTFIGKCTYIIIVDRYNFAGLSILGESRGTVDCFDDAISFISLHNKSECTASIHGNSLISLYVYSENVKTEINNPKIKIRNKFNQKWKNQL